MKENNMFRQPMLSMPIEEARAWTRSMLETIKEEGVWAIPRSLTVYQIHHSLKKVVRIVGPGDGAVEYVLGEMGWTIEGANRP